MVLRIASSADLGETSTIVTTKANSGVNIATSRSVTQGNSSSQYESTFVAQIKGKSRGRGRPNGKGKGNSRVRGRLYGEGNRTGIMPVKGRGEPNESGQMKEEMPLEQKA